MARYFIVIGLALLCSSFTICEKKVKSEGKINRIYIYPDCDDTSTYLKQRYQANHVVEYLYINSKLQYRRILDKADYWVVNEYTYDNGRKEVHRNDTFRSPIPDKTFTINDSSVLNIEYFNDGGYRICTYGYNRKSECLHPNVFASTIVFDSTYKGKMMGNLQIMCDTNTVTDAFSSEELMKIVHRERQTGLWRKYDFDNVKTDSMVYDPLKTEE